MRTLLLLITIAHTGLAYDYLCYSCDNDPDSGGKFDPACGEDGYHGDYAYDNERTCYTNVHYDGSHRVERGLTENYEEDGSCYDTGYSVTCYCTAVIGYEPPLCNNNLCQHCSITPSPTTTYQPAITTTQLPTQPPTTQPPTTQPPTTTTHPPTSNQPPTQPGPLQCYSCLDCSIVSDGTKVETSEDFLTCFTAVELGSGHLVIRGGSPDYYEDGACRHEGEETFICYCGSNLCNSSPLVAAADDDDDGGYDDYDFAENDITFH
ncbi:unnamed protein product [Meganyctiphanes norvegica]|uniref:Uncharacterized protein n=1 Tax=Meganyctiphanes norvegica TaxID=48144 RepID=A0AAV2PMD2_MEGNR